MDEFIPDYGGSFIFLYEIIPHACYILDVVGISFLLAVHVVHAGGHVLKEHVGLNTATPIRPLGLSGCSQREGKRHSMLQSLVTIPFSFTLSG